MAPEPQQIPSRTCGCKDCLIDYPPEQYGPRPPQDACTGMWEVRWRGADRKQHSKKLPTLRDAHLFLATARPETEARHAS